MITRRLTRLLAASVLAAGVTIPLTALVARADIGDLGSSNFSPTDCGNLNTGAPATANLSGSASTGGNNTSDNQGIDVNGDGVEPEAASSPIDCALSGADFSNSTFGDTVNIGDRSGGDTTNEGDVATTICQSTANNGFKTGADTAAGDGGEVSDCLATTASNNGVGDQGAPGGAGGAGAGGGTTGGNGGNGGNASTFG